MPEIQPFVLRTAYINFLKTRSIHPEDQDFNAFVRLGKENRSAEPVGCFYDVAETLGFQPEKGTLIEGDVGLYKTQYIGFAAGRPKHKKEYEMIWISEENNRAIEIKSKSYTAATIMMNDNKILAATSRFITLLIVAVFAIGLFTENIEYINAEVAIWRFDDPDDYTYDDTKIEVTVSAATQATAYGSGDDAALARVMDTAEVVKFGGLRPEDGRAEADWSAMRQWVASS